MSRAPRPRRAPRPGRRLSTPAAAGLMGLVAVLGVGLAGCGSEDLPRPVALTPLPDDGTVVEEGVHNAQDAAFAEDMIIHHRQAITMAGLTRGRTDDAKILALAEQIQSAQAPEIREMSRWLVEWGKPIPSPSADHSGHTLIGMASPEDLARLQASKGAAFDKLFLTLMITHHEGALSQAQDQLQAGADQRAKGLAEDIVTAQSAELAEMRTLLS